jgi:hypothetical protein
MNTTPKSRATGGYWEKQAILDYHARHPLEGYRRLTFMMLDDDVVAVSPAGNSNCRSPQAATNWLCTPHDAIIVSISYRKGVKWSWGRCGITPRTL